MSAKHIRTVWEYAFYMLKTSLVPQNKINRKKESKKENSSADSASKNNKFYSRKIRSKNAKYSAKITSENASKIISCLAIIAFMGFMLAKPEYYLNSARRGLSLFGDKRAPLVVSLLLLFLAFDVYGCGGRNIESRRKERKTDVQCSERKCVRAVFEYALRLSRRRKHDIRTL